MKHFLLFCLCSLLVGCASFQRMEGLDTSLVNLRIAETTPLETTLIFTMRVQNENPFPVRLEGGVHKFFS